MHTFSILTLTLTSLAALAAADCAVMIGNYAKFGNKVDFKNKAGTLCSKMFLGSTGEPCVKSGNPPILRLICHGIKAGAAGSTTDINVDRKAGDSCGLAKGESCVGF